MSLRDQLLKTGLVDKKRARAIEQAEKAERKAARGQRQRRAVLEARAEAEARAAREAQQTERIDARRARERAREQETIRRTVGNLLRDHQVRPRGGTQPFWHVAADGLHCRKIWLPERMAWDLVAGRLALGWHGELDAPQYVLVPRSVAERVAAIDAARLLFWNRTSPDAPDDADGLYELS